MCVCVCKWESSRAGQPDLSLTSNDCSLKPVLQAVSSQPASFPCFYLLFLLSSFSDSLFFFFFSFPTLISPAYSKSSSSCLGKRFHLCYQTKHVLQPAVHLLSPASTIFFFCFPAVSFLLFSHSKPSRHIEQLRDVHHWLTCVPPCSHTLNGKATRECLLICAPTQNH